jgi:maltodextrin utilization protein YvdJ
MVLTSFPYKCTFLVGLALLGSFLWWATMLDGLGLLLVLIFLCCFLASVIASLFLVIAQRSKVSLYRILINVMVCLLVFPTVRLGYFLNDRLFLMHLSEF